MWTFLIIMLFFACFFGYVLIWWPNYSNKEYRVKVNHGPVYTIQVTGPFRIWMNTNGMGETNSSNQNVIEIRLKMKINHEKVRRAKRLYKPTYKTLKDFDKEI